MSKKATITTSLDSFISLALGAEKRGTRELPDYETGLILHTLTKGDTILRVQFEEWDGTPLTLPVLWSYPEWYESRTNYKRLKDKSEKERVAKWIFEANVKIIARAIMEQEVLSPDQARAVAYIWLKGGKMGKIRAVGVKKLITKEEELK